MRLNGLKVSKISKICGIHVTTKSLRLPTLLQDWRLKLTNWAADGSLSAAAQEALRLDGEPAQLTVLISQWAAGDFSALPTIEVWEGSVQQRHQLLLPHPRQRVRSSAATGLVRLGLELVAFNPAGTAH